MRIYFVIAQHCKIQSKLTKMLKNSQNLINVLRGVMVTYHGDNSGDIKMFIHTKFGLFSARQLGLNFSRRPIHLITKIQLVYRNRTTGLFLPPPAGWRFGHTQTVWTILNNILVNGWTLS